MIPTRGLYSYKSQLKENYIIISLCCEITYIIIRLYIRLIGVKIIISSLVDYYLLLVVRERLYFHRLRQQVSWPILKTSARPRPATNARPRLAAVRTIRQICRTPAAESHFPLNFAQFNVASVVHQHLLKRLSTTIRNHLVKSWISQIVPTHPKTKEPLP